MSHPLPALEGKERKRSPGSRLTLYELASVQLRKRMYAQAASPPCTWPWKALSRCSPIAPAQALHARTLWASHLAAQNNFKYGHPSLQGACRPSLIMPVALITWHALERQANRHEARQAYQQLLFSTPATKQRHTTQTA